MGTGIYQRAGLGKPSSHFRVFQNTFGVTPRLLLTAGLTSKRKSGQRSVLHRVSAPQHIPSPYSVSKQNPFRAFPAAAPARKSSQQPARNALAVCLQAALGVLKHEQSLQHSAACLGHTTEPSPALTLPCCSPVSGAHFGTALRTKPFSFVPVQSLTSWSTTKTLWLTKQETKSKKMNP